MYIIYEFIYSALISDAFSGDDSEMICMFQTCSHLTSFSLRRSIYRLESMCPETVGHLVHIQKFVCKHMRHENLGFLSTFDIDFDILLS